MRRLFNDHYHDSVVETLAEAFVCHLNQFAHSETEHLSSRDGYSILCTTFGDKFNTNDIRSITDVQIIDLLEELNRYHLNLSRQEVVYCLWSTLNQVFGAADSESSHPEASIEDTQTTSAPLAPLTLTEIYEGFRYARAVAAWVPVGPVLVVFGVTQAINGWLGDTLWLRVFYPPISILFGCSIFALVIWSIVEKKKEENS